jgi:hypothetical protein
MGQNFSHSVLLRLSQKDLNTIPAGSVTLHNFRNKSTVYTHLRHARATNKQARKRSSPRLNQPPDSPIGAPLGWLHARMAQKMA